MHLGGETIGKTGAAFFALLRIVYAVASTSSKVQKLDVFSGETIGKTGVVAAALFALLLMVHVPYQKK